ncbi:response regulator [Paenibacillus dokdonensis]|uniref:Response regulator n=1 Tax=Paenibacillus dokdonensis TaxID=2567944 RepID=A0ABU6GNB6_9BACL|nr:response regulator [Paenibacillus dokdonensis]MEC0240713.1 response regulator [Paenibacillus dokdonensis]
MGVSAKYKVILVDDEPMILRSLQAAIDWEGLGLEVAGTARNGEGALKLISEHSPDVVISDIRMPGMDGIALMKEVLTGNPKRVFIVISGYGEFEYAREALRQGAFDYMLKPIDHDELTGMLQRAAAHLDAQTENDKLLHSVHVLSVMARERMFSEWIEGNDRPLRYMQWMENSELEQEYFMAVVQLDHFLRLNEQWLMDEKRLWLFAIRNILEEWSLQHGGLTVFPFHSGEWIILLPKNLQPEKAKLGNDLIYQIKRYSKLSCSVGISRSSKGIGQLSMAYQSATRALYQRFYSEQEGVFIDQGDMGKEVQSAEMKYPKHLEAALMESVRTLDSQRMATLFDELKLYIEQHAFAKEAAERLLVEIAVVLYRHLEYANLLAEWPLDGLIQDLHEAGNLNELIGMLKRAFARQMNESLRSQVKEDGHSLIEKAKVYITNHYHKDLSMEEVAEVVDLSISHFCTLFKQMSGYTFLEYLTQCRMEKAKYILKHTSVKVYQIAPLVGYQDAKYFTQVFKKATGRTPSEFREETG